MLYLQAKAGGLYSVFSEFFRTFSTTTCYPISYVFQHPLCVTAYHVTCGFQQGLDMKTRLDMATNTVIHEVMMCQSAGGSCFLLFGMLMSTGLSLFHSSLRKLIQLHI